MKCFFIFNSVKHIRNSLKTLQTESLRDIKSYLKQHTPESEKDSVQKTLESLFGIGKPKAIKIAEKSLIDIRFSELEF